MEKQFLDYSVIYYNFKLISSLIIQKLNSLYLKFLEIPSVNK